MLNPRTFARWTSCPDASRSEMVKPAGLVNPGPGPALSVHVYSPTLRTMTFFDPDGGRALVPTGIAVHMADPHLAALVLPRSGMGHKRGLVLGNLVGLIDPDYTGPILVSAWNRGTEDVTLTPGERFAQLMFVPVIRPVLRPVQDFSGLSKRGAGGFGW